jgi:polyphosphate kinase 2 (PPK2 family)
MAEGKKEKGKQAAGPEAAHTEAYPFEVHAPGTLRLSDVDLAARVEDKKAYKKELGALQEKLLAEQVRLYLEGKRVVLVFEGWDAAGKGGAIRRLTTKLDPRGYKVWPISAPGETEKRHQYLWRFWQRLPERGELALFDRSWYGRVLVERVEGLASKAEWKRAYGEINAFERMLTEDGVRMRKFWLHIDKETQLERFQAREGDGLKRYKIGPEDWRNRKAWEKYEEAVQDMLDRTHRPDAPWQLVAGNDKRHARLAVLRSALEVLKSA